MCVYKKSIFTSFYCHKNTPSKLYLHFNVSGFKYTFPFDRYKHLKIERNCFLPKFVHAHPH